MTPPCETEAGCPIYEIASDPLIEEFLSDFLAAKVLKARTGDPESYRPIYEKWDLYRSPYTLLELEEVYAEWTSSTQERSKPPRT